AQPPQRLYPSSAAAPATAMAAHGPAAAWVAVPRPALLSQPAAAPAGPGAAPANLDALLDALAGQLEIEYLRRYGSAG
ncbi:MAG TPA: hypothetical protein PLW24_19385, partial [Burkholderiaceae bacterium]|nr:hypothetical protein [Burkholderiaceae bacterium]